MTATCGTAEWMGAGRGGKRLSADRATGRRIGTAHGPRGADTCAQSVIELAAQQGNCAECAELLRTGTDTAVPPARARASRGALEEPEGDPGEL